MTSAAAPSAAAPVSAPADALTMVLSDPATPRWLRELSRFLSIKSQFVLYGNIRDRVPFPIGDSLYDMRTVHETVVDLLALRGCDHFISVDPVNGVTILVPSDADPDEHVRRSARWLNSVGADIDVVFEPEPMTGRWRAKATFARAVQFAERLVHDREKQLRDHFSTT